MIIATLILAALVTVVFTDDAISHEE